MRSATTHPRVRDILDYMESWAPAWLAESWDRVGLFTGRGDHRVARAWVALEATPDLLARARAAGVDMVLAHHPPFLKPLGDLRADRAELAPLLEAALNGPAVFAAHTNLDAAKGGVNDALAGALGLVNATVLDPAGQDGLLKLVVFVPPSEADDLAQALYRAGAGDIGDYRECSFAAQGVGSFLAPENGRPFVGQPGQREQVEEIRLETLLPATAAGAVTRALLAAHPYEEPAFDLYPLKQPPAGVGLGRVGELPAPLAPGDFAAMAAERLQSRSPLLAGDLTATVTRVAVLGGSGGGYLSAAKRAGAQALVTGEAGYHAGQQAEDLGICLVTLGHYQTEAVIIEPWAKRLSDHLSEAGFSCLVEPYREPTDPWRRPDEI